MHIVIQGLLSDFADRFGLSLDQSRLFESFAAFSIANTFSVEIESPQDHIYLGEDPGIDSLLILIDGFPVQSLDEAESQFQDRKRDADVDLIFIQAKTTEKWSKADIQVFGAAVQDFLAETPKQAMSDFLQERKRIANLIFNNVGRVRGGVPICHLYFVCLANTKPPTEIEAARCALVQQLDISGLFSSTEVVLFNRDECRELYKRATSGNETSFSVLEYADMPTGDGISASYVALVPCLELVDKVLSTPEGRLRTNIFDENVRDFLGVDNQVNSEISETLADEARASRFGVLNNGITLLSPDIRMGNKVCAVKNYQIVNGCQTSNVLYYNRELLSKDVYVLVKIVGTDKPDVADEIVRATNKQSKVEDYQFLATLQKVKQIDEYFVARGMHEQEYSLVFERRKNQFAREKIPNIRRVGIQELARSVGALWLDRPDLASRYPGQLVQEMSSKIFDPRIEENAYYTAAYASYRLTLHLNNKRISPDLRVAKWHLLTLAKHFLLKNMQVNIVGSKSSQAYARVEKFFSSNDEEVLQIIEQIALALGPVDSLTRDRLKVQSVVTESIENLKAMQIYKQA